MSTSRCAGGYQRRGLFDVARGEQLGKTLYALISARPLRRYAAGELQHTTSMTTTFHLGGDSMTRRISTMLAGSSLFVIASTLAVHAQTAPSRAQTATPQLAADDTEEIVVTARRKAERLQ